MAPPSLPTETPKRKWINPDNPTSQIVVHRTRSDLSDAYKITNSPIMTLLILLRFIGCGCIRSSRRTGVLVGAVLVGRGIANRAVHDTSNWTDSIAASNY